MKTKLILISICGLLVWGCDFGKRSMPAGAGSPGPKTIEAERFVLKDSQGRVLATLDNAGGQPILAMLDKSGKTRLQIALSPDGDPFTVFSDKDGKPVFTAPSK